MCSRDVSERALDRSYHPGHAVPGPVLQRLLGLGTIRGLVFGAYMEASADVHDLITYAAGRIAGPGRCVIRFGALGLLRHGYLPHRAAFELDAEIRHMQPLGEQARLGVEIQESDKVRKQRHGITGYVMARQIEIARIDAERRRAMESYYPSS